MAWYYLFVEEKSVNQTLEMGVGQINNFWVKIKIGDGLKCLTNDCTEFEIYYRGEKIAQVKWNIVGKHNMHNALMAIAAAHHVGLVYKMQQMPCRILLM